MEGIVEEVNRFLTKAMNSPQVLPWENWAPDIDFSTWESFGLLWDWAIEQDWWEIFLTEHLFNLRELSKHLTLRTIPHRYINPERFAKAVYEYLNDGGSPSKP